MRVHIETLCPSEGIRHTLQNDGWHLVTEKGNFLCFRNPSVPDEVAARTRLHELGLLTSRSLRIEFDPIA